MTAQEEQMLNSLVERVNSTQLAEKDMDAGKLLDRGFAGNPDAVYVLAQSVLVQNIALEQARAQLLDAQGELAQLRQQPVKATSFLGNLLGHREPQAAQPPYQPQYQQVYTPQAPPEYQAPYGGPQYGPQYGGPQYVAAPMGQPSFLRSAAQTAAGVAAGALAFEGVEALLHGGFGHPGYGMGMGGWGMPGVGFGMGPGMGYERPIEENVVNNYYDSPEPSAHERQEHQGEQVFHDSSSDGGAQLSDASWDGNSGGGSWDDSGNSGAGDDSGNFGGDDGVL